MRRRPSPRCPLCGSLGARPVVYGHPLPGDIDEAEAGRIVLGGLNVHVDAPDWLCTECQNAWRAPVGKPGAST